MDEIELKPCPFCGGDAEMQQGKYQGLRTFYVSCSGCGARQAARDGLRVREHLIH